MRVAGRGWQIAGYTISVQSSTPAR